MASRCTLLLWLAFSANITWSALAQDVGDKVVVISEAAEITSENNVVETTHAGAVLFVREVRGESVGVQSSRGTGFLEKRHVIPLGQAVKHWSEMIRKSPEESSAYIARGLAYRELGEFDKAIADYSEALHLDSESAPAYLNRGVVWIRKRNYDKAIEDFTAAIGLKPNYSGAYSNRGAAWQGKGDHQKAIANYNEAIRLDPQDPVTYFNRGNSRRVMNQFDDAIADYSHSIQIDPRFAPAYLNRGQSLADKSDYAGALSDFQEALRIDPTYARAYERCAWLWATCPNIKFRNGNQAVASALRACDLDNGRAGAFIATLAAAYAEAGDFDKAVRIQSQLLELAPEAEKATAQERLKSYQARMPVRAQPRVGNAATAESKD